MSEHKTNSDIRISNTKRLTNLLFRKGQMTKQELALALGISQPTVATILKDLEAKGLVRDGEVQVSTGGRKPLCHVPVFDAKYSVGVESGRHVVRMVILDLGNNCIASEEHELEREYSDAYWKKINELINAFVASNHIDETKLLNVGITIDETMRNGVVISEHESIKPIDLEAVANLFDYEVFFQSSAKMAAIAQIWASETSDEFVYISLGTNIRGAMVTDNHVNNFEAVNCEFGYILEQGNTKDSGVKLVDRLGASAILDKSGLKNLEAFAKKVEAGDKLCNQLLDDYIEALSRFLFNIHMIFGWKIIIGGRLSPLVQDYKQRIEDKIYELCKWEGTTKSIFEISEMKEQAAVIGAALLPIDNFLSRI
ncbi:ROK family transcriptional regulator [Agathobacter sp.]|uniref:ROK family transcriptional regulator n=1 Tax=Agathobacter sp. TaxID=2021311 RepID=UPI0025833077|nr:ROK family transcriptional regulator [Agathobacter sp.]